jgi:hypothetical protein
MGIQTGFHVDWGGFMCSQTRDRFKTTIETMDPHCQYIASSKFQQYAINRWKSNIENVIQPYMTLQLSISFTSEDGWEN